MSLLGGRAGGPGGGRSRFFAEGGKLRVHRALEGGAGEAAVEIGLQPRLLGNQPGFDTFAQHGRHRDVGDGEFVDQIFLVAHRVVKAAEPALDEFDQARPAQLRPLLVLREQVDIAELEQHRFDAVIGGEQPGERARARLRVARHQPFVLFGKVEQDRAALEQSHAIVAEHGDLPPWLEQEMVGGAVDRADQMFGIIEADFLARPARAKVADIAAREIGDPVKGGDFDVAVGVHGHDRSFCFLSSSGRSLT